MSTVYLCPGRYSHASFEYCEVEKKDKEFMIYIEVSYMQTKGNIVMWNSRIVSKESTEERS